MTSSTRWPRSGVAAVVVERLPAGWDSGKVPAIVVADTLVALGRIANYWRRRFNLPVIGVTGSNGKTTVKEMISSILAAAFGEEARLATRGNLNNEIGVPLTLFRLSDQHKAAVIEMGMNHPGEIARLAAIAAPTLAMVNNAQREHQEFMHTVVGGGARKRRRAGGIGRRRRGRLPARRRIHARCGANWPARAPSSPSACRRMPT